MDSQTSQRSTVATKGGQKLRNLQSVIDIEMTSKTAISDTIKTRMTDSVVLSTPVNTKNIVRIADKKSDTTTSRTLQCFE